MADARKALNDVREQHAAVMGKVSHAELLLSAFEGKIADDEVPMLPPGDPAWIEQALSSLSQALTACSELSTAICNARIEIRKLAPEDDPDLALSINLDIVVSRHRATPRGTS